MGAKRFLLIMLVSLLFGGFLYAGFAKASEILPADRALVTFRRPLTQGELQDILQGYELTPTAIYMVNAGLVGTHRTYEVRSTDEFLTIAQKRTIEAMQKGLQSNTLRLKKFVEQHSEEEVLYDENLQQELRSLLNIRFQIEMTLKVAQGELPSIYAAEVSGKNVARLQSDERIASIQEFNLIEILVIRRRPPVPTATFQQEFMAPKLQTMGPHNLYRYAENIAYQQ